jgi:hypothetical protein
VAPVHELLEDRSVRQLDQQNISALLANLAQEIPPGTRVTCRQQILWSILVWLMKIERMVAVRAHRPGAVARQMNQKRIQLNGYFR